MAAAVDVEAPGSRGESVAGLGGDEVGDVARQGTSVIVLPITDATSDQTQMPSTTLMHAVAIWLSRSSPIANGAAAPHTVARAMIQPKNARGLGVATASPCASPVATSARTKAVSA